MAVVEIIMLERMLDGVVKGRYSLGWALLPLFQVSQRWVRGAAPHQLAALAPSSCLAPWPHSFAGGCMSLQVGAVAPGTSTPQIVPMVSGTPRYLLMRSVHNEELRAPKVLQNCSIVFQVRRGVQLGVRLQVRVTHTCRGGGCGVRGDIACAPTGSTDWLPPARSRLLTWPLAGRGLPHPELHHPAAAGGLPGVVWRRGAGPEAL